MFKLPYNLQFCSHRTIISNNTGSFSCKRIIELHSRLDDSQPETVFKKAGWILTRSWNNSINLMRSKFNNISVETSGLQLQSTGNTRNLFQNIFLPLKKKMIRCWRCLRCEVDKKEFCSITRAKWEGMTLKISSICINRQFVGGSSSQSLQQWRVFLAPHHKQWEGRVQGPVRCQTVLSLWSTSTASTSASTLRIQWRQQRQCESLRQLGFFHC